MESHSSLDRATLSAFVGAVLIGGNNFLAVKFSNEELEPMFGAALRFAAATVLLLLLARLRHWELPRGRAAAGAALYGLFGFGITYACLYFALVELSPGLTSVVVASVPLVTLVVAVLHRQERFTTRGIFGGLLGVAGIALLSGNALGGDIRPVYFLAAVLGVAAIAESTVIVKATPRAHPFTTNAVGMGVGALFLTIASLASREEWVVPQRGKTWLALAWLVVAGSIGLFALYLYVVARWTASATNYAVTLMPIVAVTTGVLFADEELTMGLILGALLVIAAVYIGALLPGRVPAADLEAVSAEVAVEPASPGG